MKAAADLFLDIVAWLVLVYFVTLVASYLALGTSAFFALRRYARRLRSVGIEELLADSGAPRITLIAPAYNEEATCIDAVHALLTQRYPDYEIVVVNDGSRDATLARLIDAFGLEPAERLPTAHLPTARVRGVWHGASYPNLWVVDKENGGKADALNAGINHSRSPIFCAMDADTLLERDALARVVRPFLEDSSTVCAGGIIRIVNGCTVDGGSISEVRLPGSWIARFQILEYLRAFLSSRMGWDTLDATLIISGAFGLFRRDVVVEIGGYARDTVGEDMELVVRLHRHCRERRRPYRITYIPDPVAWTECPESIRILSRQRDRWQRGLAEVMTRHRAMLLNPRHGRIGLLAFPYFFFLEMLGPVVELLGYIAFLVALALGQPQFVLLSVFFVLSLVLGISLSIAAVALEELTFHRYARFSDLFRLFLVGAVESFGYRQLSSWWRIQGMISFLRRRKGWGTMQRKGFGTPMARPAAATAPVAPEALAGKAR